MSTCFRAERLGVENVYIDVDNLEIPILDGSAESLPRLIEQAGIVEQPLARRALLVREKVSFQQGDRRISVDPGDHYEIDCLIDFPHPLIGVQKFSLHLNDALLVARSPPHARLVLL